MADIEDEFDLRTKRHQRNVKWAKWQHDKRHWGGGLYKPEGHNYNAIARFDIDRIQWRDHEYRKALAVQVLAALFEKHKIAIGNSPPHWPYRLVGGQYKHATYPMIMRCLNQHLAFTRDHHIPVKPPPWLPEAICLFATYEFMDGAEDDANTI